MTRLNRRRCIITGFSFAVAGTALKDQFAVNVPPSGIGTSAIDVFREAVRALKYISDPESLKLRIEEVKDIGRFLISLGTVKIPLETTCDPACNHWLQTLRSPRTFRQPSA
jgi:hypothetical protein